MRGTNGAVSAQSCGPESFRTVIRVYSESQIAQMWSSVLAAAAAVLSHAQEEGRGTLGGSLFSSIYLYCIQPIGQTSTQSGRVFSLSCCSACQWSL